jgi:FlaA1/EpsC-like NDP-sugar epimerase
MPLEKLTTPVLGFPRPLKRLIVLMVDLILCIFAALLAFYLRVDQWVPLFSMGEWRPLIAAGISIILALPIFIGFGLYREVFRHSGWLAISSLLKAVVLYGSLYCFIVAIWGVLGVPRTIGILQPIILLILVGASRGLASYFLSNAYRRELSLASIPKVLIYGAGNAGRQLAGALSHSYEMQVVGFLDDDPTKHGQLLVGKRVYSPGRLEKLVKDLQINTVLLAMPSANRHRRNQIIQNAKKAHIAIQTLPSMSDLAQGKVGFSDLRSLDIDDLLGRELVLPDSDLLSRNNTQKIALVTGAGGSIGSELCRQILDQIPKSLILVEQSEFALYQIHQELAKQIINRQLNTTLIPKLASITNKERMQQVIRTHSPDTIYHAAAYKHVPLVEENIAEGVYNNVYGTLVLTEIAKEQGVSSFILISTDKAVRPTNVMGASKRVAEMILQTQSLSKSKTCFSMVRFGNVLNSSGSVVPRFQEQIKDGGPITITDLRITRYFMTIPEAAQLVIQAGAMASGGDVFLLDMGEPIKILDLAKRMIELSGLQVKDESNPHGDIEIREIGLRPGEKLYEELLIAGSPMPTIHPRIFRSHEQCLAPEVFEEKLKQLMAAISADNQELILQMLKDLVMGYSPGAMGG